MPVCVATLLSLALTLAGSEPRAVSVRRVTIQEQVIVRVPVRPRAAPGIEWKERGGPRCIGTRDLVGATLAGDSSIDFVYRNKGRYRARLDSGCAALDFYTGFYLQPDDDRICAGRDSIRSRMGAICRIEQFRTLQPRLKKR